MDEGEQRQAVAEGVLERLAKREWHQLDLLIAQTGDIQFWAEVLRFELDIGSLLSTGILMEDQVLKSLIEYGVRSISAFHYAGVCGAEKVIRRGLQFRLNVDVGLGDGVTVLHLATFAGKLETVVQLVDEFKANVNVKDRRQWRPLHYACAMGHREVAEFLTRRGVDIGARDIDGATAAYRAKEKKHEQIVSFLLESDDKDDIMLVRVDATLGSTPIYAVPCRKNVARSGNNDSLCNEIIRGEPGPIAAKSNDFNDDIVTHSSVRETDRLWLFQKEELNGTQLTPNDREGLEINYDLHQVIKCHLDGVETNELSSQNISETEAGEISEIPMHGYTQNNQIKYEKIDLYECINSCRELLEEGNESRQSKAENESDRRLEFTQEDPSGFHKITNFYEELPEDNRPQLKHVVEIQTVQSRTSSNEPKTISVPSSTSSYSKRKLARMPTYEEIKLPGDRDSPWGEVNEDNATIEPFPHSRITKQINFPAYVNSESEFDEDDTVGSLPQILNRKSKSKKFNDFTNSSFRRRSHHYEEIKLPEVEHAESQTEQQFDDAVDLGPIELRVRSVLQAELGKLVPSICNRISQMSTAASPAPRPSPEFIREFFQVGNYSDDEIHNNDFHDIPDSLISFRHLHRLIREEMQAFAGDTYLVNISKEFSDECMASINILHRSGSQSPASFCSQTDRISSATDENSRPIIRNGDAGNTRRNESEERIKLNSYQKQLNEMKSDDQNPDTAIRGSPDQCPNQLEIKPQQEINKCSRE